MHWFSTANIIVLAPATGRNWTDEERRELDRLHTVCRPVNRLGLGCGNTDRGDPWCAVYDEGDGKTVIHIARIDRRYFVVLPKQQRPVRTATLKSAVDAAVDQLMQLFGPTSYSGLCGQFE